MTTSKRIPMLKITLPPSRRAIYRRPALQMLLLGKVTSEAETALSEISRLSAHNKEYTITLTV